MAFFARNEDRRDVDGRWVVNSRKEVSKRCEKAVQKRDTIHSFLKHLAILNTLHHMTHTLPTYFLLRKLVR